MEHSLEVLLKTRNRTTIFIQLSHFWAYTHEKKIIIWKNICIALFTAALFTLVRKWKQLKHPSTEEWTKVKCVCVYTHIHTYYEILVSHSKELNNKICSNMEEPRDFHTEWSKSDRQRQTWYNLYVETKKMGTKEFTKQK